MSARDRILARVRRAAGEAEGGAEAARAQAAAARLAGAGARHAPPMAQACVPPGPGRLAQFRDKLAAVSATVSDLPDWSALPAALAVELRDRNLPAAIRMGTEPAFAGLDWSALDVTHGPGRIEEPAALSKAFRATAETGTLALLSGPANPVTLTFLAETHFIAVDAADVEAGLDDVWAALRQAGADPRTVNLVTGPSRSADIGQQLQLGAHGPVALHVFLIGA